MRTWPGSTGPLLTKWAEYLSAKGLDPEEQLSTDDFRGASWRTIRIFL